MKIEPTGIVLVDVCNVQTEKCTAKQPAAITAVWTLPGRLQVNVCVSCLEEQVRAGEWEIQGARIRRRVDVAVYSPDKKLQLVVEVKKKPKAKKSLRKWAAQIHRNLIAHAGIPNAPYFLLAILPGKLYLWKDHDPSSFDREPDYEIEAQEVLKPYFDQAPLPLEKASEYHLELLMNSWLKDIANAKQLTDSSLTWLQDSGLFKAIANGSVVMQTSIAA
jgi:hypothetical protein